MSDLTEKNGFAFFGNGRLGFDGCRDLIGADDGRSLRQRFVSLLDFGKVFQRLRLPFVQMDPRVTGHVRDRVFARQERRFREVPVQNAVKPICLVDVAIGRIGNALRATRNPSGLNIR